MIEVLAMAAAAVTTCPGGPIFSFHAGTADLTTAMSGVLPAYVQNMNSSVWRQGWINVSPTVLDTNDRAALKLVQRRERAIRKEMRRLGIARSRVRFEALRTPQDYEVEGRSDVYFSTLSVPTVIFKRVVSPGVMC